MTERYFSHLMEDIFTDFEKHYPGRCKKCFMRNEVCICTEISKLPNKMSLTIVMHKREARKTTNTGRLAAWSLEKSRILVRGLKDNPLKLEDHIKDPKKCILLGVSPNSIPINQLKLDHPLSEYELVVPDGSWGHASSMLRREPLFKQMTLVELPSGAPSRYFLRHEPHPQGLSTLEAIARTYGYIESKSIQTHLEKIFEIMVQRTLKTRPKNRQEANLNNR